MQHLVRRKAVVVLLAVAFVFSTGPVAAQNNDNKPTDQQKAAQEAKDARRKVDELIAAGQQLPGAAGHPECVFLGRTIIGLLYRDDVDTAARHLDMYDRFGCPGGQIQVSFRCLILQQDKIDTKQDRLDSRANACWLNPANPAPPAPPTTAAAEGTTTR